MQDFRNLKAWQKAHALTLAVYRATARFPGDERFGLTIQLRRTATSVPTFLADGCGRTAEGEFLKCLSQATAVGSQLEYQLLLARDLEFLPDADYAKLAADTVEVRKMVAGLMHSLNG
ncbi:MAG TPA: four helix bundle protein [Gemmataceae bacterium]|nr:four helix bundle protein [Gemmataceae bacterium]